MQNSGHFMKGHTPPSTCQRIFQEQRRFKASDITPCRGSAAWSESEGVRSSECKEICEFSHHTANPLHEDEGNFVLHHACQRKTKPTGPVVPSGSTPARSNVPRSTRTTNEWINTYEGAEAGRLSHRSVDQVGFGSGPTFSDPSIKGDGEDAVKGSCSRSTFKA